MADSNQLELALLNLALNARNLFGQAGRFVPRVVKKLQRRVFGALGELFRLQRPRLFQRIAAARFGGRTAEIAQELFDTLAAFGVESLGLSGELGDGFAVAGWGVGDG